MSNQLNKLVSDVTTLVNRWNTREDQMIDWLGGAVDGGPEGDGRYPITDALGETHLVYCPDALDDVVDGPSGQAKDAAEAAKQAAGSAVSSSQTASDALDSTKEVEKHVQAVKDTVDQLRKEAENSANNASSARNVARDARDAATASEKAAGEHKDAAAASEDAAAASENNAAASEDAAASSASKSETQAGISESQAKLAEAASDLAGVVKIYATHEDAENDAGNRVDGDVVEVSRDETLGDSRVRYTVLSGTLVLSRVLPEATVGTLSSLFRLPSTGIGSVYVRSFWTGSYTGGGRFHYDPAIPRSDADGIMVIDTAEGSSPGARPDAEKLKAYFSYQGSGSGTGCFVRNCDRGRVDLEMAGAVADGQFNNTPAFLAVHDYVASRQGNSVISAVPAGTYIYHQWTTESDSRYYGGKDIFVFRDCKNISFEGNRAVFKLADGTRFGQFNDTSGESDTGRDSTANGGGRFIFVLNSENVDINNVRWDGNEKNHIVGGRVGDTGWQVVEYGCLVQGTSRDVNVSDSQFINSGLDGISFAVECEPTEDPNITVTNVRSTGNGRQAVSVTGGNYIKFIGCYLGYTGRGRIASAPASAIDFEPEGGRSANYCKLIGCTLISASRAVIVTTKGYGHVLTDCQVLATESEQFLYNGSNDEESITFVRCFLRGNSQVVKHARFYDCTLDDDNTIPGFEGVQPGNYMLANIYAGAVFDNFVVRKVNPKGRVMFRNNADLRHMTVKVQYDFSQVSSVSEIDIGVVGFANGPVDIYDEIEGDLGGKINVIAGTRGFTGLSRVYDGGHFEHKPWLGPWTDKPWIVKTEAPKYQSSVRMPASRADNFHTDGGGMEMLCSSGKNKVSGYVERGSLIWLNNAQRDEILGYRVKTSGENGETAVLENIDATFTT